jgi:hypothetical protein
VIPRWLPFVVIGVLVAEILVIGWLCKRHPATKRDPYDWQ